MIDHPMYLIFLLTLFVVDASKCPPETVPYPPWKPDDPDSCYLFISYLVVRKFWIDIWGMESLGQPLHIGGSMDDAVWDPWQARNICKHAYQIDQYKHLENITFRLPIIESGDEDYWLYDEIGKNRVEMGTHFWLDLEYDSFNKRHYWATTGEEADFYFADRGEDEKQEWEDDKVIRDDEDDIFRVCFEFHLNEYGLNLKGWHRRACGQAYSRMSAFESCTNSYGGVGGWSVPFGRQVFWYLNAPTSVVCELSMFPEPKTDAPCCKLLTSAMTKVIRSTRAPVTFAPTVSQGKMITQNSIVIFGMALGIPLI